MDMIKTEDGRKLIVRWTPGHERILGNEAADELEEAKKAILHRMSSQRRSRRNDQNPPAKQIRVETTIS
jgi:ribonuclease HI